MNERSEHAGQSASAIEALAALWLERRHLGKWDDEMQSAFDVWMSESSAHVLAYWRLDAAWGHAERLVALTPAPQKVEREKKIGSGFLRITAIAGVILAVAGAAFYFRSPTINTYATALGELKTVTLADGSKI